MEKNRLEAFSDGVLAIIITIMVLELKQPAGDRLDDFLALAPTILAYLLSFIFIAIYWVNHHHIFHKTEQINVKILWSNIVWLFILSFIPFTTAWVGAHPSAWAPLSIYFANMMLAGVAYHIMYYLIFRQTGGGRRFRLKPRSIVTLAVYFLATVLGGFCPVAAFSAVAAVNCWWIVPAKDKA